MIKQSILLLMLCNATYIVHAMDNHKFQQGFLAAIQRDNNETRTKQTPHFCLYECDACGKECNTRCICKGVYYCSKECQRDKWKEHKSDCKEIKKAFTCNQKQMENFFNANIETAITSAPDGKKPDQQICEKSRKKAIDWMLRLLINYVQENLPREDVNLSNTGPMLTFRCWQQIKSINAIPAMDDTIKNSSEKQAQWICKKIYGQNKNQPCHKTSEIQVAQNIITESAQTLKLFHAEHQAILRDNYVTAQKDFTDLTN